MAELLEAQQKERTRRFFLAGAFLLPVLWLFLLRIIAFAGGENSADVFFHIRFAEQGAFFAREFSAIHLSDWKEAFADPDWLFHLILWILTGLRKLSGSDPAAPFHWEYLPFLFLLNASFIYAARRMGIRARTIFSGSLLLPLLTMPSAMRLTMLCPHILALAILFFLIGALAQGSLKARIWKTIGLSFLITWSFAFPQIAVLVTFFYALFAVRQDGWKSFLLPMASIAGIVSGLLIHPHSPHTFSAWQMSHDAICAALSLKTYPELILTEWSAPDGLLFVSAIPLYVIVFVALLLTIRHFEFRGRDKISATVLTVMTSALFFTLATFWLRRTVEFAVPFAVLAFLALSDSAARDDIPYPRLKRYWKRAAWILAGVSVILAVLTSFLLMKRMETERFSELPALRQALHEGFSKDYILINGNCADFAILYYETPHLRWLWGFDPACYMKDHRKKIENLTSPVAVSAHQISSDTGLHYLVLLDGSEARRARKKYLVDCGWRVIGDFPGEGWIFTDLPEKK